ncbi:hypothetical protein Dimus_032157 [Dionaea muscipula]
MAQMGNLFDLLGDEDGDHVPTVIDNICKKLEAIEKAKREAEEKEASDKALAAAKARGEVLKVEKEAPQEPHQRESRSQHSGSERGRGRGGRGRGNGRGGFGGYNGEPYGHGGRPQGVYDGEQYGNGKDNSFRRNYNGHADEITNDGAPRGRGRGGGGRGRGRGQERVFNGEDGDQVGKEANQADGKQVEGVKDADWKDIPLPRQKGHVPGDVGDGEEGFRSYNADLRDGQKNFGGERGDGHQRYRGVRRDGYQNYGGADGKYGYQTNGGERGGYQNSAGEKRDGFRNYAGKRRAYDGSHGYGEGRSGMNQTSDQSNAEAKEANNSGDNEVGVQNDNVPVVTSCKDNPYAEQDAADIAGVPKDGNNGEKPKEVTNGGNAAKKAEQEEEEEENYMTLEEYEKLLSEKRKGLEALRAEERKVALDKDFEAMQLVEKKKDDIFVQLKSEKGKLKTKDSLEKEDRGKVKMKDSLDKEEKVRKVVSINEFLRPAEGEEFAYRRLGRSPGSFNRGDEFIQRRGGDGRGQDFTSRRGGGGGGRGQAFTRNGGGSEQENGGGRGQDFPSRRGGGGRGQDFTRNGGGRDQENGGGRAGDFAPRNGGGRDPVAELPDDNSQQGSRPVEAVDATRRGGSGSSGGYKKNNNNYNGYSRPRVVINKAPDVADPGQFPALGGGVAVAKA